MPWAWTPDSKAVFISSAGDGQRIYRQSLTDDPPALVVAEQEYDTGRICVSPDGEWLVYERRLRKPSEPYMMGQLVRIPINGGEAQKILDLKMLPDPFLNCTRAPVNLCVIVERTEDRKFLIVSTFDVLLGRGPELIKIPIDAAERDWTAAASPDGTHLAVILGTRGPVRILSLDGKPLTQFSLSGWTHIEILSWTADSKAVLVSGAAPGKAALLRVDLDGRTQILCENRGANSTYAVPSPDGRHIAFTKNFTARNAWMIEGF
jgi:Tol biopolymer transport system component